MTRRLLIIGYVWPEPRSSAAGSRMLQLIEYFLQQSWHVVFGSAALLSEQRFRLDQLGVEEKVLSLNCSSFNDYIAEIQPDMVLFDRFFTEEQFGWRVEQTCPNAFRVLDTEDLHSLRNQREQQLKRAQKNVQQVTGKYTLELLHENSSFVIDDIEYDDLTVREIAAIFRCDLSLIISRAEMQYLHTEFSVPESLLLYLPLLPTATESATPDFSQRQHFMTIGNFRHAPNWDAVLCLKHSVWPLIRAQLPRAELHIFGAYLPPKASALHNPKNGFHIRGWTENAPAAIMQARVCLAPLRFGAGLKGKLLEAMSCDTPSVTTPIGAEGMHGNLPWCGAVTTSSQEFATAAVTLHENEILWHQAVARGREILQNEFPVERNTIALTTRLQMLFDHLAMHRRNNFVGQMLRHHMHKSTQYMSQWIEAKNRHS
jgi:glycosyltransferase involved in cell wall biosynthesis